MRRGIFAALVLAVCAPAALAQRDPHAGTTSPDLHFGLFQAGDPQSQDSVNVDPHVVSTSAGAWMTRGFSPTVATLDVDTWVRWVQSINMQPVITLQSIAAGDSVSSPPADTTAWKLWVTSMVERYDGDGRDDMPGLATPVHAWHVEQEWHIWWSGTVDDYLAHLAMTYRTIRQVDLTAQVILIGLASPLVSTAAACQQSGYDVDSCATFSTGVDEITRLVREGLYDVVDLHSYETWAIIAAKVEWVRTVAPNPDVPIWSLEAGGPSGFDGSSYTDADNAAAIVQQFAQALGNGMARYTWALFPPAPGSTWDYAPWTDMPLSAWHSYPDSLTLKPAYYTYRVMVRMLSGFSSPENLSTGGVTDTLGAFMYRFQVGDSTVYVVWNSDSTERDVSFHIVGPAALLTHIVTEPGVTDTSAVVEMVWPTHGVITFPVTPTPVFFKFIEAATDAPPVPPPPDPRHEAWSIEVRSNLVREGVRFRVHGALAGPPLGVRALVYDVRGRVVRDVSATLHPTADTGGNEALDATLSAVIEGRWDGRTGDGADAASGVYFLAVLPRSPAAPRHSAVARLLRIAH